MKNWTIGKRIAFGFGVVVVILICLSAFNFVKLLAIQTRFERVAEKSVPRSGIIDNIRYNTVDVLLCTYKVIGNTDRNDMDVLNVRIKANLEANGKFIEAYKQLSLNEPLKMEAYEKISEIRGRYLKKLEEVNAEGRQATNAEQSARVFLKAKNELDPISMELVGSLEKMDNDETKDVTNDSAAAFAVIHSCVRIVLAGALIATLLGIGIAFMITRRVNHSLQQISTSISDSSMQVSAASGQVASSSQSLAEGASEQAASIEETSSSLEEMSSMTRKNAESSEKTKSLARETSNAANKAVGDMKVMSDAMNKIKVSSDEVAKIIKTIDEIAFQTNILALNAAVEAARAGDAGMGFAVVADEVRNLAQRSALAAKETAEKIEGAISHTAEGVELSGKVAIALNEIVTKAKKMDDLAAEVASASHEQAQGVEQVNMAVSQMDKVTQSTASNAEESAAAAEELNAQAQMLQDAVKQLLEMVDGAARNGNAAFVSSKVIGTAVRKDNKSVKVELDRVKVKSSKVKALTKEDKKQLPMEADFA